jgi:hypothetical protein
VKVGGHCPETVVIGMEPKEFDPWGTELTPPVQARGSLLVAFYSTRPSRAQRISMITEQTQAGSSVESACRKCKTITDHHVVIMLDEKIGKVQCKVCGGKHAYRPPKAEPSPKASRSAKPKTSAASKKPSAPKKPAPEVEAHWRSMIDAVPSEQVQPYAMSGMYQAGNVIDHSTFGLGYVQKFIKPNMIEVLFKDGIKNLRCCA